MVRSSNLFKRHTMVEILWVSRISVRSSFKSRLKTLPFLPLSIFLPGHWESANLPGIFSEFMGSHVTVKGFDGGSIGIWVEVDFWGFLWKKRENMESISKLDQFGDLI